MKFTRSKDGIKRTNVTIRFRVGSDALHTAAASAVWSDVADQREVDHDEMRQACDDRARTLTRGQIKKELRKLLKSNGYSLFLHVEDQLFDLAVQSTEDVVARLWPGLNDGA